LRFFIGETDIGDCGKPILKRTELCRLCGLQSLALKIATNTRIRYLGRMPNSARTQYVKGNWCLKPKTHCWCVFNIRQG